MLKHCTSLDGSGWNRPWDALIPTMGHDNSLFFSEREGGRAHSLQAGCVPSVAPPATSSGVAGGEKSCSLLEIRSMLEHTRIVFFNRWILKELELGATIVILFCSYSLIKCNFRKIMFVIFFFLLCFAYAFGSWDRRLASKCKGCTPGMPGSWLRWTLCFPVLLTKAGSPGTLPPGLV